MHNQEKLTLKQYLTRHKDQTLIEGIQLTKIGTDYTTTAHTLTKYDKALWL